MSDLLGLREQRTKQLLVSIEVVNVAAEIGSDREGAVVGAGVVNCHTARRQRGLTAQDQVVLRAVVRRALRHAEQVTPSGPIRRRV